MRILVVEDHPKMAATLEKGLGEHGYVVDVRHTGFDGEDQACAEEYDLIVLDRMLPDRDGIAVCRNLRQRGVATPVLMLTALSGTQDTVDGLEAGADDYLAKPFEFQVFIARVRALLRRRTPSESIKLTYGDLTLDLAKRTCERQEQSIRLTAKEFALLEFLMRNPERVLTRTTIAERVWDMAYEPTSNVIDVYISALRRKIDRKFDSVLIHTVVGAGYQFGGDAMA